MLPILAILGFGRKDLWVPIPIPLFLLWPVVIALVAVVTVAPDRERSRQLRHFLLAAGSLSGLRVDVVDAKNHRFLFWII